MDQAERVGGLKFLIADDTIRVRRRDQLGDPIHEYSQAA
jgi:hypothetical protein